MTQGNSGRLFWLCAGHKNRSNPTRASRELVARAWFVIQRDPATAPRACVSVTVTP